MASFQLRIPVRRMRQLLRSLNGSRTFLITKRDSQGRIYVEHIDIMKLPPERWNFPGTPEAVGRFSLLRDAERTNMPKVLTECCPAMELALSTVRAKDSIGLMREQMLVFKTGVFTSRLILRIHKSPGSKVPGSWIELNFCPFCGAKVNHDKKPKPRMARSTATQSQGDNTTYRAGRKGKATVKRH